WKRPWGPRTSSTDWPAVARAAVGTGCTRCTRGCERARRNIGLERQPERVGQRIASGKVFRKRRKMNLSEQLRPPPRRWRKSGKGKAERLAKEYGDHRPVEGGPRSS